jgi:tetratricopeptide (TPR) repeat protein
MFRKHALPALLLVGMAGSAAACMWDYDTLLMERRKFPGTIEMISGKFLRHSPEFYHWRIRDRTEKLKSDPNRLEWYDDLAVAYAKTGDHARAIEIIKQKDALKTGLYETEANWGTFLLFNGQWEEALVHVRKALEINPNAHFGREKYQALLIEYVIPRLKDGKPQLPLGAVKVSLEEFDANGKKATVKKEEDFESFLRRKLGDDFKRDESIKALLGMMHFAEYRSPILLEPLASLLIEWSTTDGQRLASRAYLRAAEFAESPAAKAAYLEQAEKALERQVNVRLPSIQAGLAKEIAEADAWFAELREAEKSWIADGKDPEAEFLKRYPVEPETAISLNAKLAEMLGTDTWEGRLAWQAGGTVVFCVVGTVLLVRHRRRRRAAVAT